MDNHHDKIVSSPGFDNDLARVREHWRDYNRLAEFDDEWCQLEEFLKTLTRRTDQRDPSYLIEQLEFPAEFAAQSSCVYRACGRLFFVLLAIPAALPIRLISVGYLRDPNS